MSELEIKSFPERFQKSLKKEAGLIIEKETSPLEKKMLRQHELLVGLTSIPYSFENGKIDPFVVIIGAAQGLDNALEAPDLYMEAIRKDKASLNVVYVPSGAIGITSHAHEKTGKKGINAEVIAEFLKQNGVPVGLITVEKNSLNTPMQAKRLAKIKKEKGFTQAVAIVDLWHGPRFYMTMIRSMPQLRLFTKYISKDSKNIGSALNDLGQAQFQAPIFIAEIARLHRYTEDESGPVHPTKLMGYLENLLKHKAKTLEHKKKMFSELMKLWDETHDEILKEYSRMKNYR